MRLRSLLFVPADRPERFDKAVATGADAILLDLEDSVAPDRKAYGRDAIRDWLAKPRSIAAFVRVNPLDGGLTQTDLDAVLPAGPDGLLLPKAEGAASVETLLAMAGGAPVPPILPIATETASAIFHLGSYGAVKRHLCGITWGAEDLSAALGASHAREEDGRYTPPFEMVRSLTLFSAHAAGLPAIETVFPNIGDAQGLAAYIVRARRDGYTGMMAIHPAQVAVINTGFAPSDAELAHARAILDAFAANPGAGALKLDGKMIDRPHLLLAQRILGQTSESRIGSCWIEGFRWRRNGDSECWLGWRSAWMGKPCSDDVRDHAVASMAGGRSCREAGSIFGVAPGTAGNWYRRYRRTTRYSALPMGGATIARN